MGARAVTGPCPAAFSPRRQILISGARPEPRRIARPGPAAFTRPSAAIRPLLPVYESVPQPRELTVKASVDEQTSNFGHEATEELAIGDFLEHHLLTAEGATEAPGQRRALGLAERHRGAHARSDAPRGLVL